jgi:Mg-chelatase subunit ChlD
MGDNNKLQKAKDGVIEFIDLVEDRASNNTGFRSKIGIIEYRTQADMVVAPTQNYDALRTAVTNFYAG